MSFVLLDNDLLPHRLVLRPQIAQLRGCPIHHCFTQLYDHGIQPCTNDDPVQSSLADRLCACVHFLCFCLLLDERFADSVVSIHQCAKIVANLEEHIVRVSPAYLLNPLHFLVVLLFLRVRRGGILLLKLRLQIIQYILNLACGTLDVLVELAPLLDCCNRSIRSSQ
jgi:hypothetical protein